MVNIVEVKLPGSIDLGWEGQQVRRSVHQPYPSLCKRRQHHRPGKVTRGMMKILLPCGNAQARSVVVGSEMRREAPSLRGIEQLTEYENRLRRLNHDLYAHLGIGLKCTH